MFNWSCLIGERTVEQIKREGTKGGCEIVLLEKQKGKSSSGSQKRGRGITSQYCLLNRTQVRATAPRSF